MGVYKKIIAYLGCRGAVGLVGGWGVVLGLENYGASPNSSFHAESILAFGEVDGRGAFFCM